MAGPIVRQEVFGSSELKVLMREMGWSRREALGCLALLWNGSQHRKAARASASMIGEWCDIEDPATRTKLVQTLALETCGFLKMKSLDRFEICGAKKEISAIKALKCAQKRGGEKTRAKWIANRKRGQDSEQRSLVSSVVPPALPSRPPTYPPSLPGFPDQVSPVQKTEDVSQWEETARQLARTGMLTETMAAALKTMLGVERFQAAIQESRVPA